MSWALLRHLPDHDRKRIMRATTRRRFARGEVVFHEGDVGDALHLISRGRVAVRASTPMGEIATFAVLGPCDFFGEQALVSDVQARTATVVALEPLETLAVGRATFDELRAAHPSVERFLVDVLAAQVRRLSAHLLEALFLPAEKRGLRDAWWCSPTSTARMRPTTPAPGPGPTAGTRGKAATNGRCSYRSPRSTWRRWPAPLVRRSTACCVRCRTTERCGSVGDASRSRTCGRSAPCPHVTAGINHDDGATRSVTNL
jgi:CRP-like cAMP-binding protein